MNGVCKLHIHTISCELSCFDVRVMIDRLIHKDCGISVIVLEGHGLPFCC